MVGNISVVLPEFGMCIEEMPEVRHDLLIASPGSID
jgi:hypothetical protein